MSATLYTTSAADSKLAIYFQFAAMVHCSVNVSQAHLPDHVVGPPLVTPDFGAVPGTTTRRMICHNVWALRFGTISTYPTFEGEVWPQ